MAELTIQLRVDPTTRRKDVVIIYHSDDDALPLEHEHEHRALVERLLEKGVLSADELGEIVVEREQAAPQPAELSLAETGQGEALEQES